MKRLPKDPAAWPPELRHRLDERAAIREHDGGQGRGDAEHSAEREIRVLYEAAHVGAGGPSWDDVAGWLR